MSHPKIELKKKKAKVAYQLSETFDFIKISYVFNEF